MAVEDAEGSRKLDQTPTWAVVAVSAVILLISILLEKGLHRIGEWLTKKHKRILFEALEKVKAELMILGFISLLLKFGENQIIKICLPYKVADTMLPCPLKAEEAAAKGKTRRLLLMALVDQGAKRKILAVDSPVKCPAGKVPIISVAAMHQLHIFIFFLAVVHVINSAFIMALGRAKIRRWKEWEKETQSVDYAFTNDPSRFRYANEVGFVRIHTSFWNRNTVMLYVTSFFNQFFMSVTKADFFTLRHGFISVHLAPGAKFNFQKYIKRALEDDFKVVVGISPTLWVSVLVVLLINFDGYRILFWASFIPLAIILTIGMKLQAIITRMAAEIQERHTVVQGIPVVHLSDKHFWFGRPKLLLFLIHLALFQVSYPFLSLSATKTGSFILVTMAHYSFSNIDVFQNAFQIAFFFWIWYEFDPKDCFRSEFNYAIARITVGFLGQILCSYITLPLYALVSQMGSHLKRSIFDEHTTDALKRWHQNAKKNSTEGTQHSGSRTPRPGASARTSASPSVNASPAHSMHRYTPTGHTAAPHIRASRKNFSPHGNPNAERYISEQDDDDGGAEISLSEMGQLPAQRAGPTVRESGAGDQHQSQEPFSSFSFVKLTTPRGKRAIS